MRYHGLFHQSVLLLHGVDFRLAATVFLAVGQYHKDNPGRLIRVTSGFRTEEEQAALVASGASKTMRSAHREGLAVDLAIIDKDTAIWELSEFRRLDTYMQAAALRIGLLDGDLLWGGHWTTLRDGPHWQLMLPAM